eukprot:TRINITY_DN13161_c0_g1_i1.p1 TRINITY_DN13161_c0_g1~~TRINITY_DN13161_c0_g1_i1.p1  ORF type:complete len:149 (+),score=38.42 TRINITY_DN13161_c0_g1_i1:56-502(+)
MLRTVSLVRSALTQSIGRSFAAKVTAGRFYLESHEWIDVQEDGTGTVGISDFAQNALGEVVFVELPAVGDKVEKGGNLASVESVKASSVVYSPVTGEVTAVNKKIESDNTLVNSSAEKDGWFAKVKVSKPEELSKLMSPAAYAKFTAK